MKPMLEKKWSTSSSLEAVVLKHPSLHHRCGYVGVLENHGLYLIEYQEIERYVDVHGGLTFSGELPAHISPKSTYWFGYDCSHSFDKTFFNPKGIERTLEYCVEECERLAKQLYDSSLSLFYLAKKLGKLSTERHNRMLAFGIENPQDEFVRRYLELPKESK